MALQIDRLGGKQSRKTTFISQASRSQIHKKWLGPAEAHRPARAGFQHDDVGHSSHISVFCRDDVRCVV